jgi:hypothetical protein
LSARQIRKNTHSGSNNLMRHMGFTQVRRTGTLSR